MPTSLANGDNLVQLDPPDTGIAWLDIALLSLVAIVTTAAICIAVFSRIASNPIKEMKSLLFQVKEDAAVTREQTENSHTDAENPNLRHDIDRKHEVVVDELREIAKNQEHLAKMLSRMEGSQERTDAELARVNKTLLADREAVRDVAKKLDTHIESKEGFGERIVDVENELALHRKRTEKPL